MSRPAIALFASLLLAGAPSLPETPKKPVTDDFHGVSVTDEYRWLEKTDDPIVRKWIEAQDRVSRAALDKYPALKPVRQRLAELRGDPGASYAIAQQCAGRLFALKHEPGKEQRALVTLDSPDEPASARVVVDPNALDEQGKTTIDFYTPSPDGKLVAVSLSKNGSEEGTLHVYDVATGKARPDTLPRTSLPTAGGCVAWDADGAGFCYTRYPRGVEKPKEDLNFYQQVYHHQLGEPMERDEHVLGRDFPRIAEIFLDRSEDGAWLLATVQNGDGKEFTHYLKGPDGHWSQLTQYRDQIDAAAFGRRGDSSLYLLSLKGTPRGKVLRLPLGKTDLRDAQTLVAQGDAAMVGLDWQQLRMIPRFVPTLNGLFILESDGGPSLLRFVPRDGGKPVDVPLPPVCSVNEMVALDGDEVLLNVATYTAPSAWYAYRPNKGDAKLRRTALSPRDRPGWDDVEVVRTFAASRDGTKVPLTLLYRKGLDKNGKNPTLLTGYGGYGMSLTPHFDATRRLWLEHGGVLAIANIRGGGEYGEEWHRAAMLTKRQNAYDDFLACARLLIEQKYTNPARLAIEGGSNGGLLMGVALTQHPELFRAVVSHVGLYDMLRFEMHPNGVFNTAEYGSVKDPAQFKALYAYSPLHHVKDGTAYPAVLLTTGVNDGRVDPAQSYKMAARLQAATSSKHPVLLRVHFDAGHGMGEGFSSGADRRADVYAFLFEQLGIAYRAPMDR
jgi:prolyl oligopeptidase